MRSDEELVGLLRAGDGGAFGELVERYHTRVVRLAQSVGCSRDLAEDVAQETWIAVLNGVDRFEGRSTLRTWLFRVCVNRARSMAGRERRVSPQDPGGPSVDPRRFTPTGQWSTPPEDWADKVDDRLVAAALAPQVKQAIERLPDSQRQVVTLRDVEGLSSIEVCEVLAISAVNERVLLHRGRSRIRAVLESQLGGS